jgi:hypothetical protein
LHADHPAQRADHREYVLHGALIENMHGDAVAYERGGNVRLKIREPEHEIGLELEDPIDLRAREGGDFRFLLPCSRRAHREAGNTDDAPLLAERVQRLRCLLRHADDAFGVGCVHPRNSTT